MKIIKFPELRQSFDYDCGAKATEAVLAYYGIDAQEDKIIEVAGTNKNGTPLKGIVNAAEFYGLSANIEKMTIDALKMYLDHDVPVIILLQAWAQKKDVDWENDWMDGHYVVAIGYDDNHVYFEDPYSVLRTFLAFDELLKRWHDIDSSENKKYVDLGIIIHGQGGEYKIERPVHMD